MTQGTQVTSRTDLGWSSWGLSEGNGEFAFPWGVFGPMRQDGVLLTLAPDVMLSELLSPETQVDCSWVPEPLLELPEAPTYPTSW